MRKQSVGTAMRYKILNAIAIVVGLYLFSAPTALAAPMLCSGEQKTCIAACQRSPLALIGDCIANCRTRFNYCRQTGCWDNGTNRYCGLLRQ
jgi:hypothetical protein